MLTLVDAVALGGLCASQALTLAEATTLSCQFPTSCAIPVDATTLIALDEELEKTVIALSRSAGAIQGQLATLWLRLKLDPSSNVRSKEKTLLAPI
jgi:hypothetical protein